MSPEITEQAALFVCGLSGGAVLMLAYDLLRIWRRVVRHGTVWMAVEDILYWCGCAVACFLALYRQDDGRIRWFIIAAAFVGMALYHRMLSRPVLAAGVKILRRAGRASAGVGRFFGAPLIRGIGCVRRRRARHIGKKYEKKDSETERLRKNRLKNVWKTVKMWLCRL